MNLKKWRTGIVDSLGEEENEFLLSHGSCASGILQDSRGKSLCGHHYADLQSETSAASPSRWLRSSEVVSLARTLVGKG